MNKLYNAFEKVAPNDFEKIEERIHTEEMSTTTAIEVTPKRRNYKFAFIASICAVLIISSFILQNNNTVFATVGVDVNPSVELNLDNKEKVVEVITHNKDGQKILGDMKLEGSHIDVAMNALIGSMLKEGYINELKNSLLISVTGENKVENERIRKRISREIDDLLRGNYIDGAIISQTLNKNNDLEELSERYNISIGKAEIIQQLIQKNKKYTFEKLKDLNVNELNILLSKNEVNHVQIDGKVSTKKYIGQDKVKEIVQSDSQIFKPKYQKIELDYDDGKMVYEVEFIHDSMEYDYELDAISGKILKRDREQVKSEKKNDKKPVEEVISKSKAKEIAMNHAKVKEITNYKIEKDNDDGVLEYEIEFVSGNKKYEYVMNASNGKILKYEIKTISLQKITSHQAKKIALKHAGLLNQKVNDLEVELEDHYYEVSFETKSYEYEYKIDAKSGKIINYEKEKRD